MIPALTPFRRALLASAASLLGAVLFAATLGHGATAPALVPILALVVAAFAVHVTALGAQLLARALWWSNLALGALMSITGGGSEFRLGLALALACAAGLTLADRRALAGAAETAGFRPVAYAGTLQLLMVLALADAQTMGLFALIALRRTGPQSPQLFALFAAAFVVAFVGLYRLALWGVVVGMSAAVGLLATLTTGALHPHHKLVPFLYAIATLQLAAPLPMIASMVSRRPLPSLPPRARSAVATVLVAAVALAAVAARIFRAR